MWSALTISMMRIESVKAKPDRSGRFWIKLEDGTQLSLYRQTIEDFALYPGKELSDEQLLQLQEAAGAMSAKMRAVRIVAASSVSKQDLQHRLIQKGENPQDAADAVAWMEEMSLVDDEEIARQVVSRCIAKGYGLQRAKQALYEKRIPKQYWETALADYPTQNDYIVCFLKSKITDPLDDRQIKKTVDALLRRGHSYGEIRRGLQQISADSDVFLED